MALPTFAAGQWLNASDLNDVVTALNSGRDPLWTMTGTTSPTTGSAAEKVHLSAPSSTYKAHTAYRLRFGGLLRSSSGTGTSDFRVRDTNVAGTLRWQSGVFTVGVINTNYQVNHVMYVANTTGSDITSRVLCLTMSSGACTVLINSGASQPYFWECIEAGVDTDFPNALAL